MINAHFRNIKSVILKELKSAKRTINVAVYWFTNHELLDELRNKVQKGIKVSLIIHNDYINNRETGLDFQSFIDDGGSFFFSNEFNPMHNKFCIIDDKILINGSYNWTYYAENRNWENILLIKREKKIINSFANEFESIISSSQRIEKVSPLTRLLDDDTNTLGTIDYLANDIILQAKFQNKTELVDSAFQIAPNNIEIQKIACDLQLRRKLRFKNSIGASLKEDRYLIIVPQGSVIPYQGVVEVKTSEDLQTKSTCDIYYGENKTASKNKKIGSLTVSGLPPKPAGESRLKITTIIDLFGNTRFEKISLDTKGTDLLTTNLSYLLEEI